MKNILILFLLIVVASNVEAQQLGLKVGVNLTNHNPENKFLPGKSIGIFFDKKIHRRLELSIGVISTRYSIIDYNGLLFTDGWPPYNYTPRPSRTYTQSNFLEIPIEYAFNLADDLDARWKLYATGGYAIGQLINKKSISYYADGTKTVAKADWKKEFNKALHIFSIGLEVRHYNKKIKFATGIQVRYYPIVVGRNGPYGIYKDASNSVAMYNLYFKSGFDLKKKSSK